MVFKRLILVFDEFISGLDFKYMKEVVFLLKEFKEKGEIVYVIIYDLELIVDCCIDVIYLENGRIVD